MSKREVWCFNDVTEKKSESPMLKIGWLLKIHCKMDVFESKMLELQVFSK